MIAIISLPNTVDNDNNFLKLTHFCGAKCNHIQLNANDIVTYDLLQPYHSLVLNVETLFALLFNEKKNTKTLLQIIKNLNHLFVYNFKPDHADSSRMLQLLTKDDSASISSLNLSDNSQYAISKTNEDFTRELSGAIIEPTNKKYAHVFNFSDSLKDDIENIITVNKKPLYVSFTSSNCHITLKTTGTILNIDNTFNKSQTIEQFFLLFIPEMMFIKHVSKSACWNISNTYANFIIDDPYIRTRYGCVNYKTILNWMNIYNFAITIAFIPWNYKRSNKETVQLFHDNPDKLSICIHGCDHTKGEFSSSNFECLDLKLKTALSRMKKLNEITNIKYENVFVFPQGIFSIASMKMLKHKNYVAAVNSGIFPVGINSFQLTIRDVLDVAIQKYENFPLFSRKYPNESFSKFQLDAFLGKPLLIVEHHKYFKDKNKLESFIKRINSISGNIVWNSLNDVVLNTYLEKVEDDKVVKCKIFTSKVIIKNNKKETMKFIIIKEEINNIPIKFVKINKEKVAYNIDNNFLMLETTLKINQNALIEIEYEDYLTNSKRSYTLQGKFKIACRRYMCDFRDNYL